MSQLEKQQKLAKKEKMAFRTLWIPILLLLAVVPLIVKLSIVPLSGEMESVFQTATYGDFFSQGKSIGISIMSIAMLIMLFLFFDKNYLKKNKQIYVYIGLAVGFLGLTLVSSLLSDYREIALWGVADRAEGFVTIACYILMFIYTIYIFRDAKDYKWIVGALSFLILVLTVLGVFQYFGQDLLMENTFFNKLVLGSQYAHLAGNMSAQYESGRIYGTLYHYNYMGSFGAMIVPIFMVLTLFIKGYKKKIGLGFITLCALFLLLGSTSRAGLIGLGCSILVGIIVWGRILVKKWKWTVPVVAVLAVVLIGFNAITNGTIFARIPTLVEDAFGIFMPGDKGFDYRDHIPVRSITSEEGVTRVVMQDGILYFVYANGGLVTIDEAGNSVLFEGEEVKSTLDERFSALQFELVALTEETEFADGMILSVSGMQCFVLAISEEDGICVVDGYTNDPMEIVEAPAWGFEGKEQLGSARGYIWSRSIPMLKDTLLLGNGPDTYVLEFPQDDLLAKWWAYGTPNMVVDKPHNLYLQIALSEGVVALVIFMALVLMYLIDALRLYALRSQYDGIEVLGMATSLGIIGYLGAGIFNDSIISVAPIFWILLGVGVSLNYLTRQSRIEAKKRMAHATVDMQTREHL